MTLKLTTIKGYAGYAERTTYKVTVHTIDAIAISGSYQYWEHKKLRYSEVLPCGTWYWNGIHKIEVLSLT